MSLELESLKDKVQTLAAIVALVATLGGVAAYFSGVINSQAALATDNVKLNSRVAAIEDVLDKANIDRFRIDRSEQDIAKLSAKVDAMSSNVTDMRVMLEKLVARSERRQ